MILKLTKQDLMMAATASVGWYHWEPTKIEVELSAKGDSHNISIFGLLVGGDQPHQEEFEGKQVVARFNTKLIGKLVPALRAFGWEVTEDMDLDTDELKKKLIGEKVDIQIKHRDYQGNPQEDIAAWLPYGASDSLPV